MRWRWLMRMLCRERRAERERIEIMKCNTCHHDTGTTYGGQCAYCWTLTPRPRPALPGADSVRVQRGFCEMPTGTAGPVTIEKALKWYNESEAARNREWRRFMALRNAAERAMKFGELGALGDVLSALDDPRWLPFSGL
jgi:hypothetical protein